MNIKRIILICLATQLLLGCSCTTGDKVIQRDQSSLERLDNFFILHLTGSPTEIGQQHAALLKDSIKLFKRQSWDYLNDVELKDIKGPLLKGLARLTAYKLSQEYLPYIPREYLTEMKAIAKTSGISFDDVLLLNVINEIDARATYCTSLVVNNSDTTDNSIWHAYNTDAYYPLGGQNYIDEYKGIIFYYPDQGHSFVTISTSGYTGLFCGMNEKGISVSLVHPTKAGGKRGLPIRFLVRSILQKTSSLSEAVEMIKSAQRTITASITLVDGNTNEAVTVSFSHRRPDCAIKKIAQGVLIEGRGERELPDLLSSQEKLSITDLVKMLRYKPDDRSGVCSNETSYSMIFHPASLRFWVALGKTPAPLSDYYGFDLKTGNRLRNNDSLIPWKK